MPSQKNVLQLDEVKAKVDKSTAMFFVDYAGLTHQQLEEARRELSENESEIAVIKNTLMAIALKEKNVDAKEQLQGPAATLFAYGDGIKTAKVLAAFVKKYGLPKIKFGYFEDEIIDASMIEKLSKLPSKEILIAKLLGTLNAPISNFVYVLNGNITKLAQLLKAIEEKKGQDAPAVKADEAPAETPAEVPAPAEAASEVSEAPAEEAIEPSNETVETNEEVESQKGATSN
jgi:large subunit ribosomal protein L10